MPLAGSTRGRGGNINMGSRTRLRDLMEARRQRELRWVSVLMSVLIAQAHGSQRFAESRWIACRRR